MSECRPDLTVTVVSWNTRELLRACLQSLDRSAFRGRLEVHVVDNASADGSDEMVRQEFPNVELLRNSENLGFAAANNRSFVRANGRYWLLLNSDTEVRQGALDALVQFMDERPGAGMATARLVNQDGSPQQCAMPEPSITRTLVSATRLHWLMSRRRRGMYLLGPHWSYDSAIRLGWTWGAALVVRRAAVGTAGLLSETFFMYGEDVEWCLRMKAHGWEIWYCPDAEVLHHGAQSSHQRWDEAGHAYMIWNGLYDAIERHRGRWHVIGLKLAMVLSLTIQWLLDRARGKRRAASIVGVVMLYHLRSLVSHSRYAVARSKSEVSTL